LAVFNAAFQRMFKQSPLLGGMHLEVSRIKGFEAGDGDGGEQDRDSVSTSGMATSMLPAVVACGRGLHARRYMTLWQLRRTTLLS